MAMKSPKNAWARIISIAIKSAHQLKGEAA